MFSRDQIDQVRAALDIAEVIREYVPTLKASGRSVKGLCPFHSERTPSFHVHSEKGLFKCFGCGESGDVIAFLSKIEQVSFTDAVRKLADRAGIRLQQDIVRNEPEGIREKLYRVLDAARSLYEQNLWDERLGQAARAYLESRGVKEDTVRQFELGFAPSGTGAVFETLVKKGFPIDLCQQAGLVTKSSAGRYYDPLFGRLVFPIYDSFGHSIGFGGRTLPEARKHLLGGAPEGGEGPKYLNSPESPVFSKGKSLYGLTLAKTNILAARRVVILEGYMDVIGVHQAGFPVAVATLGTAFTRDHAKLLKRYADEVVAFFDPDEAGQKAAFRSLEPMLQEGFFPRVVMTTETADPDELARMKGPGYLDQLISEAPDFVDFVLRSSGASPALPLPQKTAIATQLIQLISQSPNEILKSEWAGRVANALGLRPESLQQELGRRPGAKLETAPPRPTATASKNVLPSGEDEYLALMLLTPQAWPDAGLEVEDFEVERHRRLFELMMAEAKKGPLVAAALCDLIPETDREWFVLLSMEDREWANPSERKAQLVRDIRYKGDMRRLKLLKQRLINGQATATEQAAYNDLLRRVKGSGAATNYA